MIARTISSSFAANRRIISSGGSEGGSGFVGGGGAGNFVDSGGCIGPAACARSEAGAAARTRARAQPAARRFDLCIVKSASICWMLSAGILQHGSANNLCPHFCEPSTVYRGAPDLCYNRAAAKTSLSAKCCRGNAGQAIFRVRQGAGGGVPLFRRANSNRFRRRRICEKSLRRTRGSLCHRQHGADGCVEKRIAARTTHGRRGPRGRTPRGNSAGICERILYR